MPRQLYPKRAVRIAITGGTGFVGGHLAAALIGQGHEVILVARGVDRRPWASDVSSLTGVRLVAAGLDDQNALTQAFAGCEGVAHCAGINRELAGQTFEAVHVQGTRNAVGAAERAGARRFALVSFLRARPNCGSPYHESKWAAEEIVRASNLAWTVLKPGMMFGRGDHMLDHLTRALRTFPIFVGMAHRRMRPLAVEDAVAVLMAALVEARLDRKTVALMGPTELEFDEAVRGVAKVLHKHPTIVDLPAAFSYALAWLAERLMTFPLISIAQVRILAEEVVAATRAPDSLPADLAPSTPFDLKSIRRGLPDQNGFRLADLRLFGQQPNPLAGAAQPSARVRVVCGEGRTIIHRPAKDILEFVLDVDQYRLADHKIGRVYYVRREGDRGEVRHVGKLAGIPGPTVVLGFRLTRYSRLDFHGISVPWPVRGFEGSFTCEETSEGTHVVHRECFSFGPIAGRIFKVLFGSWLKRDTPAEVIRMKRLLEG